MEIDLLVTLKFETRIRGNFSPGAVSSRTNLSVGESCQLGGKGAPIFCSVCRDFFWYFCKL
jgi:hypothetical protein